MANEIKAPSVTGLTLYAVVINLAGQVWNGTTFEALLGANWANYDIALTEQVSAGIYYGTFPVVAAGLYDVQIRQQLGGTPAVSDPVVAIGQMPWGGTAEVCLETDSIAELAQAAPSGTPRLAQAISLLYAALRNKLTVTATSQKIFNDAGTNIATATLTDDGTTFTRNELGAGT